jgi:predicted NUDIX family NTP pyrophosphohydrolase
MRMVRSAGTVLYQVDDGVLRVLLAHMGGPFWARKDERAWSIPKGEYQDGEDPRLAAAREFAEELGTPLPAGELVELGTIRQAGGKRVVAYALESGFDPGDVRSNLFQMEWPRGSGKLRSFPEVDRAQWFDCATARVKLVAGQVDFLDLLLEHLCGQGIAVREA